MVAKKKCLHCPGKDDTVAFSNILRMCALLKSAPALPELESGESGPGNATESPKLGQSSRVRASEKERGLSIVESLPIPRQAVRKQPVA